MFGLGKLRFRSTDKKWVDDEAHVSDYKAAEELGRVRIGALCLYYRDLGRKYCVPYDYIDRAFVRISECQPDDSPAYYYYRVILMHGDKEFANLIFNEKSEKTADLVLERLKAVRPEIAIGYAPPADGKEKPRFM